MANPFEKNYIEPAKETNYLKFTEEKSYLFRILTPKTEVITYFLEFIEPEPKKFKKIVYKDNGDGISPVGMNTDPTKQPKLTWCMLIWNRDAQKVQIWEVTQKTIRSYLHSIVSGKIKNDWTKFDIQITKTGKEKETKYNFINGDNEDLTEEEKNQINKELSGIRLQAMEEGKDPFDLDTVDELLDKAANQSELPNVDVQDLEVKMPF